MTGKYDATVLGSGISGLSVAYHLAKAGQKTLLIEKAPRTGGVIHSRWQNGFLLEDGPNSFVSSPLAMELIRELGLEDATRHERLRDYDRFIWYGGALHKAPISPFAFMFSEILPFGMKLKLFRAAIKKGIAPQQDLEIGKFFRQLIGGLPVDRLLKPMLAGIYAADADRVSFSATLPKLYDGIQAHGSLIKGLKAMRAPRTSKKKTPKGLVSFDQGLSQLAQQLTMKFLERGGELLLNTEARLSGGTESEIALRLGDGERIFTGSLALALPAWTLAEFLLTGYPQAAQAFAEVEYARLNIVHVGLREEQLRNRDKGFGFLAVADEGIRALGVIWTDRIFPCFAPEGHRLLTCFYGGEKDPSAVEWSDAEVLDHVRRDLEKTMGYAGGDFALFNLTRWERALPVFRVGHRERLRAACESLPPGIRIIGNYIDGISIPDRLQAGQRLAIDLCRDAS
ncbi:protoporphyrinogen oxidase [Candidatus Sumerlaeota bacterium]|nr:protoporphyrinogen oxidase [Candidatus Sumerlaeota bacterium]